jgi:hypothetical protein
MHILITGAAGPTGRKLTERWSATALNLRTCALARSQS